jgi:zinc transporter ZupT
MTASPSPLAIWVAFIVAASLVGGWLPLVRRWSERVLHLFVAAATGSFLGAVFLHLLPELVERQPSPAVAMLVPLSILILFAVERIGLKVDGGHLPGGAGAGGPSHAILGHATLIGLAVHSLAEGYGLAVGDSMPRLQLAIFLSIVGHKSVEAFSLATVLLLAGYPLKRVALLVGLLALMTPAGCLIGVLSLNALPGASPLVPVAIATGTFLYVALLDLLPEVLHHRQDLIAKVFLMVAGLVFMILVLDAYV